MIKWTLDFTWQTWRIAFFPCTSIPCLQYVCSKKNCIFYHPSAKYFSPYTYCLVLWQTKSVIITGINDKNFNVNWFLIWQDKIKLSESSLQLSEVETKLYAQCNRNSLSKALLLMHIAGQAVTSCSQVGTNHQAQLLQVHYLKLILTRNLFKTLLPFEELGFA